MKILLTMHMPYFPALGGANKNNRFVAEALAERGHNVLVVVPLLGTEPGQLTRELFLAEQTVQGIYLIEQRGVYVFHWKGVQVYAVEDPTLFHAHVVEQIRKFIPDCLLVALEEPEQRLLEIALDTCKAPVVGIAQTPSLLPFGPNSFFPDSAKTKLIERATAVVASSNFLAQYIRQWSCINPVMIYMPVYGSTPFPQFRNFNSEFITMINPCHIKGISIILALAEKLTQFQFAVIPTWGTSKEDINDLLKLENISVLKPCSNIDDFLSRSRIVLMPSLWLENFPLTVIEAMLRGIPVISSNVGGIPEVKLGTNFIIPVNPIKDFVFFQVPDGCKKFNPIVPEQNIDPWVDAVITLLSNNKEYYFQSDIMHNAALKFVQSLSIAPLESLLINLAQVA